MFITFLWGEEAESFTRSVVEFLGDARAVVLERWKHRFVSVGGQVVTL